jgi:hypothetical protein
MSVVGKLCTAWFNGGWILGSIKAHRVKLGQCDVQTEKYGLITVLSCKIRMLDKEDE